MKKYDHIVRNYLIKNESRSIAIILSIALCMALVVGVGILSYSARQADIDKLVYETGSAHVSFENVSPEQIEKIQAYESVISELGIYSYYGYGDISGIGGTYLACVNPGYMGIEGTKLLKGRFPGQAGEIALEAWCMDELRLEPEINQKLLLEVDYQGQKQQQEFLVVGVLKDSALHKGNATMEGLLSLEQIRPDRQKRKVYIEFKPNLAILPTAAQIATDAHITEDDVHINLMLLEAMQALGKVDWNSICLSFLVFLIAAFVISNIYSISIYRRVQDYGMLRAIGATNLQVAWLISKEIFVLLLIGIPLGIVLGLAGAYAFSGLAGNVFTEGEVHIGSLVVAWQPILTGSLAVSLAIMIAGMKTGFMVFRISPLEAMRKTVAIQDKNNPKAGKMADKLGITHRIVWQHLRRNRGSAALTIVSMIIGSILLMAVIMYGSMAKANMEQNLNTSNFRSDFMIHTSIIVPMEQGFTPRQIQAMEAIAGVKKVTPVHVWYSQLVLADEAGIDQAYFDYLNDLPYFKNVFKGVLVKDPELRKLVLKNNLWGYTDDGFNQLKKYLVQGEINIDRMEKESQTILSIPRPLKTPVFDAALGDTVRARFQQADGHYDYKDFKVAGIVAKMPFTDCFYTGENSVDLIIPEKSFTKLVGFDTYRIINIEKRKGAAADPIQQQLRKITNALPQTILRGLSEEKDEIQGINKQILIFLYGIVIVLFMVALLNIINSINYTFLARIKEFGLMRAVGLTKRQLRSMIFFEGAVYGIISAVLSCTMGTALQIGIFHYMNPGNIKYPILGEMYAVVVFLNMVIALLATGLPGIRLTKKDMLESVREFE